MTCHIHTEYEHLFGEHVLDNTDSGYTLHKSSTCHLTFSSVYFMYYLRRLYSVLADLIREAGVSADCDYRV